MFPTKDVAPSTEHGASESPSALWWPRSVLELHVWTPSPVLWLPSALPFLSEFLFWYPRYSLNSSLSSAQALPCFCSLLLSEPATQSQNSHTCWTLLVLGWHCLWISWSMLPPLWHIISWGSFYSWPLCWPSAWTMRVTRSLSKNTPARAGPLPCPCLCSLATRRFSWFVSELQKMMSVLALYTGHWWKLRGKCWVDSWWHSLSFQGCWLWRQHMVLCCYYLFSLISLSLSISHGLWAAPVKMWWWASLELRQSLKCW